MSSGSTKTNKENDMNNGNKHNLDDDENEIHTNNKHIKSNNLSNNEKFKYNCRVCKKKNMNQSL